MSQLPSTLEHAIAQSIEATKAAIADGKTRLQVELLFPELGIMPVAQQFVAGFGELGSQLRVFFPDAGSAALARRDWGELPYAVRGIDDMKSDIQPDEKVILFVQPSSIEVAKVEALCDFAGDRPVVFLNPRLENVATIGIGYAGRQLRERFLNLFASCYYIRPLDSAALFRCYPSDWQVWLEQNGEYGLISATAQKPVGEELEQILLTRGGRDQPPAPSSRGLLSSLQAFLRALSQ